MISIWCCHKKFIVIEDDIPTKDGFLQLKEHFKNRHRVNVGVTGSAS